MFTSLCIGGGGTKLITVLGCIKFLLKKKIIDFAQIKTFYGCSAGAIISFLLIIGYTPDDLIEFMIEFDIQKLEPETDSMLLFTEYGMDDGKKMIFFLKKFIMNKLNKDDLTLHELYEITHKKFIVAVTNLTDRKIEYISYETHPNINVSEIVFMSCCVPIIFKPYVFNNKQYLDGGVLDSFPMQLGDKDTLGIRVITKGNKIIEDLPSYLIILMTMIIEMRETTKNFNGKIIKIETSETNLINTKLEKKEIKKMVTAGKRLAELWIKKNL